MTLYARQQKRHRCKECTVGLWEKARVGWFERIALKHVYYHMWNRSLVQVRCMRKGAQCWCTGMTLREGMEKEVGGKVRMGNTRTPMADSCECMQKPPQYCKVISLLLLLLLLSCFSRVRLCETPSLGFSRQEHWSGLPFPSPIHESEKWKWSHSVVATPTSRDPMDCSLPGSSIHGIFQARVLEWVVIAFS